MYDTWIEPDQELTECFWMAKLYGEKWTHMYVDSFKSSKFGGKLLSKVCVRYRSIQDNSNMEQFENIQLHITSICDKFLTT